VGYGTFYRLGEVPGRGFRVQEPYATYVVEGKKTWEVRRRPTKVRGRVGIVRGGEVIGTVEVLDSLGPFSVEELRQHVDKDMADERYLERYVRGGPLYVWVLGGAQKFDRPVPVETVAGQQIGSVTGGAPSPLPGKIRLDTSPLLRYKWGTTPQEGEVMGRQDGLWELDEWRRRWPAPCQEACPIHTDARGYVVLTALGRFQEARQVARDHNPLFHVCAWVCDAPCEDACTRGEIDRPIAIRRIKRFLAQNAGDGEALRPAPPSGRRVAIVGAGPAGLSAAYELALLAHRVVVYDAAPYPGGMVFLGIPRFRLSTEVLDRDLEPLRALGVEFRTGVKVGEQVRLAELRAQFDAVVIAAGCLRPVTLDVPGAELAGIHLPLPWLEAANMGRRPPCGRRVVVIGGGFTAMDVSRTAVRLGAEWVGVYYRRTRREMEVDEEELTEAQEEGVELHFLASPVRFVGRDGRVTGVEFIRNRLGELDASGRPRPVPIPGSEFVVEADTVVLAIGQRADLSWLDPGLVRDDGLEVDPETLKVAGEEGLFACGDFVTGSSTIVAAMAHGRRAAASVHRYLGGEPRTLCPQTASLPGLYPRIYEGPTFSRPQPQPPKVEPAVRRRHLALEVEMTYSEEAARAEASRCLYCGLPVQIRPEDCILCDACVAVCPVDCIRLAVTVGAGAPRWTDRAAEATSYRIDQEACIRCGRCLKVCPTRAIAVGA